MEKQRPHRSGQKGGPSKNPGAYRSAKQHLPRKLCNNRILAAETLSSVFYAIEKLTVVRTDLPLPWPIGSLELTKYNLAERAISEPSKLQR